MSDQPAGASGAQGLRHTRPAAEVEEKEKLSPQYDSSWAVVIGINNYQHFKPLANAVNDAAGMAALFTTKLGCGREQGFVILGPAARDAQRPLQPDRHGRLQGSHRGVVV